MTDIALVGGAGWTTLPVAFSFGNGAFQITNNTVKGWIAGGEGTQWNFAVSSREPGVQVVTGDFNKDGMTDLALVGGDWGSIRVAMSIGGGQFGGYDELLPGFPDWARAPGVKVLTGDFNGDGATDIALVGGPGWATIPVATSYANPGFLVTNLPCGQINGLASMSYVRAVVGDFNGDHIDDIALVGGVGWTSIPLALGFGNGVFIPVVLPTQRFPAWATDPSASVFAGHDN